MVKQFYTILSQSRPRSNGNEGVLHIHPSSLTIWCFIVISMTLIEEGSYPFAEMQLFYSTAPANWVLISLVWFYSISNLDRLFNGKIWLISKSLMIINANNFNTVLLLNIQTFSWMKKEWQYQSAVHPVLPLTYLAPHCNWF